MKLRSIAFVGLFAFASTPTFACPADLYVNIGWVLRNNSSAAASIRAGRQRGDNVGQNMIISGFKSGQSHNSRVADSIDSCDTMQVFMAANMAGL